MRKIELKTRKWLRKVFGGLSLTAVAFVFQACYGTEPDCQMDIRLSGNVVSAVTGYPIGGIRVSTFSGNYTFTDKDGNYDFYACVYNLDDIADEIPVVFTDIDGIENHLFAEKRILVDVERKNEVQLGTVALEEGDE